jgi:hypothetical protein
MAMDMHIRSVSFGFSSTVVTDINTGQEHAAEQDARRGLYQSKIIQQIINAMWFRNRRDEGVQYEDFFRPIKPETIALVLTVVSW